MRLGIVGTRHDVDYDWFASVAERFMISMNYIEPVRTIVSGGNRNPRGVDQLAERFADAYGLDKLIFPESAEDGDVFTSRCHARNQRIANASDALMAIRCKHSKGTLDTMRRFFERMQKTPSGLYLATFEVECLA